MKDEDESGSEGGIDGKSESSGGGSGVNCGVLVMERDCERGGRGGGGTPC